MNPYTIPSDTHGWVDIVISGEIRASCKPEDAEAIIDALIDLIPY